MSTSDETLCLACGLCCNGSLHNFTYLKEDEVTRARRLGLRVSQRRDGMPIFHQPCTAYADPHCTVYGQRPLACRKYACRLLLRLQSGEMDLPAALAAARQARELMVELRGCMPDPDPRFSLDQQVKANWPECWRKGQPLPPNVQPSFNKLASHLHIFYGVHWLVGKPRFTRWKNRLDH